MSELLQAFARLVDAHAGETLGPVLERDGYLDLLRDVPLDEAEPLLRVLGKAGASFALVEEMAERALAGPSRAVLATLAAVHMAGLAERLLDMTLDHARTRTQFGKPIGAFQAVQQQLAVMAEQVVLMRVAAQSACGEGLDVPPLRAALAKATASRGVPVVAGIAHAVHGAIGITAEFPLAALTAQLHALRIAHGSESYWDVQIGEERLANAGNGLDFIRTM